jgi:hypothetical protein
MPRYKVYGPVDYGKLMGGYVETVVEAADQDEAIEAALDQSFGPVQRARYYIAEYFDVEETDESLPEAHPGFPPGQK